MLHEDKNMRSTAVKYFSLEKEIDKLVISDFTSLAKDFS
jgi:hypothetical protein